MESYELLGVSGEASEEEIRSAFAREAKKFHPDRKDTGDEARFKKLFEAYQTARLAAQTRKRRAVSSRSVPHGRKAATQYTGPRTYYRIGFSFPRARPSLKPIVSLFAKAA